ncbi:MAG: glycosyltransferase family 4 protein [Hyphomicrobiaceae bacterium]
MKILYTTDGFPLPHMPGGSRYYQLARWLRDQGHEVTVLCNARNYLTEADAFAGTPEDPQIHDGIKIVGLPTPKGRHQGKIGRVLVYLSLLTKTYTFGRRLPRHDLVIAGTPPLLMPLASLLLARSYRSPAILEVRDLHPQMAVASGIVKNPLIVGPWGLFERTLRKRFHHIVAAVPRMRAMIAAEGNPADKVTVVTSGYDLESDAETELPPEIEHYLAANAGKFIVAYTGNMGLGAWDIRGLVQVADRLKHRDDIRFLFIGDGEQRRLAEDDARAAHLPNTQFFSSISRLQIASVMRRAGALVMAYRDNPFYEYIIPIKLFDYMGAGRPIVFSGVGDGPAILEAARGGIVFNRFDSGAFAAAVAELADDPDKAAKFGANNRSYVLAHLLREKQMAHWTTAIEKAFAAARLHAPRISDQPKAARQDIEPA